MSYREIGATLDGEVGEIVLARPETRNAMSEAMGREVERAVAEANMRPGLRLLLLRGQGATFSAGGDMAMLQARTAATEAENRAVMRQFYASFLSIRRVRVPTIAVVHGAAVGAGLCLAMACDARCASAAATFSANFVRVGLHPGMGATWLLPRLVGVARAAELLFTGESLLAEEAWRMGLVNHVAAKDDLERAVADLSQRILRGAPGAIALTKATLMQRDEAALEAALDAEADAQAVSFATADVKEALRAFGEKRHPQFLGR